MLEGKSLIGYRIGEESDLTFRTFNPILNKENSVTFYEATEQEVEDACKLADSAYPIYRKLSDNKRAQFLTQIGIQIKQYGDELLNTYCSESGLTKARGEAELSRTLNQIDSFVDLLNSQNWKETRIDLSDPKRKPKAKPDLRKTTIPIGPVLVFGASNFPLAYSTAGGDTISALASGCPVIVKSHPMHAGTGELIAKAIIRAAKQQELPEGVFSNINTSGIEIGIKLIQNKYIKAVGFTGSIKGGRSLMDLASRREEPIPVFAEMGSINPVFITENALINDSIKWIRVYSEAITNSAGQFCTNPGLIIAIDSPIWREFVTQLGVELSKHDSQPMLHPNIKKNFERLKNQINKSDNTELIVEDKNDNTMLVSPNLVEISASNFIQNPDLQQEVFGTFTIAVSCDNQKQVETLLSQLDGQLSATVLIDGEDSFDDLELILSIMEQKAGRVIINDVSIGGEVCPSMHHGGPYPASSDSRFTALGSDSIKRWTRPVSYQNFPENWLPVEIRKGAN